MVMEKTFSRERRRSRLVERRSSIPPYPSLSVVVVKFAFLQNPGVPGLLTGQTHEQR
jgi:hypothetical protein